MLCDVTKLRTKTAINDVLMFRTSCSGNKGRSAACRRGTPQIVRPANGRYSIYLEPSTRVCRGIYPVDSIRPVRFRSRDQDKRLLAEWKLFVDFRYRDLISWTIGSRQEVWDCRTCPVNAPCTALNISVQPNPYVENRH